MVQKRKLKSKKVLRAAKKKAKALKRLKAKPVRPQKKLLRAKGVAELENRLNQLAFGFFNNAFLFGYVYEGLHLLHGLFFLFGFILLVAVTAASDGAQPRMVRVSSAMASLKSRRCRSAVPASQS